MFESPRGHQLRSRGASILRGVKPDERVSEIVTFPQRVPSFAPASAVWRSRLALATSFPTTSVQNDLNAGEAGAPASQVFVQRGLTSGHDDEQDRQAPLAASQSPARHVALRVDASYTATLSASANAQRSKGHARFGRLGETIAHRDLLIRAPARRLHGVHGRFMSEERYRRGPVLPWRQVCRRGSSGPSSAPCLRRAGERV